jgi:hypothetical protein
MEEEEVVQTRGHTSTTITEFHNPTNNMINKWKDRIVRGRTSAIATRRSKGLLEGESQGNDDASSEDGSSKEDLSVVEAVVVHEKSETPEDEHEDEKGPHGEEDDLVVRSTTEDDEDAVDGSNDGDEEDEQKDPCMDDRTSKDTSSKNDVESIMECPRPPRVVDAITVVVDHDSGFSDTDAAGTKKKRKVKKRVVGSQASSIKQMKDAVVRTQAIIASSKVATIQAMTTYVSEKQANHNPRSHTVLLNFDEIVQRPDKVAEGERYRDCPKWTLLVPPDLDPKVFGSELEKLGKVMQEEKTAKAKKGKGKKTKGIKREFDFEVVSSKDAYLESIYGPDVSEQAKKKTKEFEEP